MESRRFNARQIAAPFFSIRAITRSAGSGKTCRVCGRTGHRTANFSSSLSNCSAKKVPTLPVMAVGLRLRPTTSTPPTPDLGASPHGSGDGASPLLFVSPCHDRVFPCVMPGPPLCPSRANGNPESFPHPPRVSGVLGPSSGFPLKTAGMTGGSAPSHGAQVVSQAAR